MARTIVPVAQATIVAPEGQPFGFYGLRKATGNLPPLCNLRGSQLGKQCVANCTGKGISMLGFLFGFNARIGRLHFFFSTIVVTIMMVAIYIAAITYAFQTTPKGTVPSPTSGPIFAAAILYTWLTVTLQSMRFRDIGWDPACVLPAWIAVVIVDGLVATKFPAMSLGHERGTIFGALVNLSLILALLFCPSGAQDSPAPTPDEPVRTPDPPPHRPVADPPAAPEMSRPATSGFGRRGL